MDLLIMLDEIRNLRLDWLDSLREMKIKVRRSKRILRHLVSEHGWTSGVSREAAYNVLKHVKIYRHLRHDVRKQLKSMDLQEEALSILL